MNEKEKEHSKKMFSQLKRSLDDEDDVDQKGSFNGRPVPDINVTVEKEDGKAGERVREEEGDYDISPEVSGTSLPQVVDPEKRSSRDLQLPFDREKNIRNDNRFYISKSLSKSVICFLLKLY